MVNSIRLSGYLERQSPARGLPQQLTIDMFVFVKKKGKKKKNKALILPKPARQLPRDGRAAQSHGPVTSAGARLGAAGSPRNGCEGRFETNKMWRHLKYSECCQEPPVPTAALVSAGKGPTPTTSQSLLPLSQAEPHTGEPQPNWSHHGVCPWRCP